MLSKEENILLTRTGPGTPTGDLLRRYWMPALLSWELPDPDSAPVQLKLLGENLVAFRDSDGRVGMLEELCPHRLASLWLGRNEESGLRCVYHGWKFDVSGHCVDMPNEPVGTNYRERIRAIAYSTVEMGGVIWTYMGPPEKQPPPPRFEFTQVPETHRQVTKTWEECNWLQGLEGGIDTAHAGILHRVLPTSSGRVMGTAGYWLSSGAPEIEVDETDYGYTYAGIRPRGSEGSWVRSYHFVMPFTQIRPNQNNGYSKLQQEVSGHFWVPIDDENHMVWNWHYSFGEQPMADWDARRPPGPGYEQAEGFRKLRNRANRYQIDRQMQKTENYTGIEGINTQDHAVQESMGRIVERSKEHLIPTDRAVIIARQILLRAVQSVQDGGDPPGVGDSYHGIRAIEDIVPPGIDWRDAFRDRIRPADPRLVSRVS